MKKNKTIDKYLSQLEDMKLDIEGMHDKMKAKFDAMSEKQQESYKGGALAEDVSKLEELISTIENLFEELDNAFESD